MGLGMTYIPRRIYYNPTITRISVIFPKHMRPYSKPNPYILHTYHPPLHQPVFLVVLKCLSFFLSGTVLASLPGWLVSVFSPGTSRSLRRQDGALSQPRTERNHQHLIDNNRHGSVALCYRGNSSKSQNGCAYILKILIVFLKTRDKIFV